MSDETEAGFAEVRHSGGDDGGGIGAESPLQTRAAFLQNWHCAQHGKNSESHKGVADKWEECRQGELTFEETLDFLRSCHRNAPFLFFNGNTFGEIGRVLCDFLFAELPFNRRKVLRSAVAHYIAGVLDRQSSFALVVSVCRAASLEPGQRVSTLRGTSHGVIVRVMDDGASSGNLMAAQWRW